MDSSEEGDHGFFAGRDKDGSWKCTLCDIAVCYEGIFLSHMQGEKHAKNLRNLQWEEHEKRKRLQEETLGARVSSSLNSDTLSAYTMDTSQSPETGVEAGEPMWKKDPQYSGFRDFVEQCSAQFYPDGRSLAGCGVIPPLDERPPNTWGEAPAMAESWDMVCRLCDAQLGDWYQWSMHMQAKKHRANVKSSRWSYASFWQKLTAGDFPYYYEHLTGVWSIEPPFDDFNGEVYVEPLIRNVHCNPYIEQGREEEMSPLEPGRDGTWV
ncbi:hypothetical protein Pmar_PMAR024055 [Perkinsus marinus ATCC 50983]|uniref:Matrin-type domain-containing protein n=1 Tax=Perkinsus marinus (strain ATCC 50983 / TXsc) TaxID=423536 RepID=C5L6I9_PERM5|nr:hypothetical protein Pmar_PMAR024055 [Perkinsus marinus ATCC 50983]EER07650.1 hypothetical protein Pmar_PMAR024055 [Perkinsus marinus ATCC 50983]|eukprot:XP_002775834.1 hypothetical protein Pmar_PMAR024055 [Perkinsus marinus ATCC 50983]